LTFGVTKFKNAVKGSVVIGCNNEQEREVLKENLSKGLGKCYKVHTPMLRRPTFKILRVDSQEGSLDDEKLLTLIKNQNDLRNYAGVDTIKIVYRRKNEKYNDVSIVVESDSVIKKLC
jgi:PDZ domain-containing secreted protein